MSFAFMGTQYLNTTGTATYSYGGYSGSTLYSGFDSFIKSHCRYCGQEITNKSGTYFSIDLCENCDKKLANEFWKTKIPKTSEYCQTCYSHIKACQCEEKKKLDNLKQ